MNKLRCRVLFPFVGDSVGGSHISAIELICALDRTHFEPRILLHQHGPLVDYLRSRGLNFEVAPADLAVDRRADVMPVTVLVRRIPALIRQLKRDRIDLVHTNDERMHMFWGVAARLAGLQFVLHQRSRITSRRVKVYARAASHIVTISEFARTFLPEALKSKSSLIANPVRPPEPSPDRVECRAALIAETGSQPDAATIGYVAKFTAQKRPTTFIDIAAAMRAERSEPVLYAMFGDGRGECGQRVADEIARRGLDDICRLMGPRHPIEPWIAACDVLIAPAVDEAFGRTLVEAMLCGTPVVASDSGGHREVISHRRTGFLIPAHDVAGFAAATWQLLRDPVMAGKMSEGAGAHARQQYSVDEHVGKMQALYQSLTTR